MIIRLDTDGRVVSVTESLLRETGYSEPDVLGKHFSEFVFPDDLAPTTEAFVTVLGGTTVHGLSFRLRKQDGTWMDRQITGWPVRDGSGKMIGVEAVSWDVTRPKRAEERLRRLNECFISFTTRPEENIQTIVRTAGEVLGAMCALYNRIEGDGLKVCARWDSTAELLPMDHAGREACRELVRRSDGSPVVIRTSLVRRKAKSGPGEDGTAFLTCAGSAVLVGGAPVGSLCVGYREDREPCSEDLHFLQILARALAIEEERRRMAEDTYLEKQILESALENATTGLVILDREGRVRMWNRYMEEVYRIPSVEVLGRNITDSFPDAEREGFREWMEQVMATGKPFLNPEWEHQTQRIGKRTIDLRLYPLRDRSGTVTGVAFTNLDVTDLRRGEAERERLRHQLFAAQKMQSIATLAGGIAHDFNNLLGTMVLDMRLLEQCVPAAEEPRELLAGMNRAAAQMTNLTRQLLAFARGGVHAPCTLNANRSVERVVKLLERNFDPGVSFTVRLAPDLRNIEADPTQIEQVATNLLRNAMEAVTGTGAITVSTENAPAPETPALGTVLKPGDPTVRLSVQDTGSGMDELTAARIFEPFFSTKFPGRGLGMAAVLGIVRNHGGIIDLSSKPGRGTRVDVYLPITERPIPKTERLETSSEAVGRGETVLVVDEEENVVRAVHNLLAAWGFRVLDARAAVEAIEQLVKSPDAALVLLDLRVTRGEDSDLFRQIRRQRPDVKVIVWGSGESVAEAHELLEAGAEAYLQEPFTSEELRAEVLRVLASR